MRLSYLLTILFALPAPTTPPAPKPVTQANFDAALSYSVAHRGEALLVQQNGVLLFSKFSSSYTDGPHTLASGTKSFSCAIEAFAEADNLLKLDDPAANSITDWQADNRKLVTIGDLLSLESGLQAHELFGSGQVRTLDTYALSTNRPVTTPPRQVFVYDPLSFESFALILQVRTGGVYTPGGHVAGGTDPVAYLQQKLFTPLGIDSKNYVWQRDELGHPQMAGGLSMHATDWLKYGQWMLQNGAWNGKQLIDPKLLTRCHEYPDPAYGGYGISWWLNRHSGSTYSAKDRVPADVAPAPGSDQIAPHAPADTYIAAGAGKQRLYVIPSLNLVVVRFAPLSSAVGSDWSDDKFLNLLLNNAK